jgi:hypothetical protein
VSAALAEVPPTVAINPALELAVFEVFTTCIETADPELALITVRSPGAVIVPVGTIVITVLVPKKFEDANCQE